MQKRISPTPNSQLPTSARGFTLVEVLVSTAIITVVMLVAIGAIITVQDANRKAQAIRALIDNLHGAVENMSRKIRTGDTYHCGHLYTSTLTAQNCYNTANGYDTAFVFYSSDDVVNSIQKKTEYRLQCSPGIADPDSSTGACRAGQTGQIIYSKEGSFNNQEEPLTDPKIDVKSLRFYVHNATATATSGGGQPSVLITIKGEINIERVNIKTPFNIQTTISQYIRN